MEENYLQPISVIIPAYNEEDYVGEQVGAVRLALSSLKTSYEIIVVNDGSTDGTQDEAIKAGARLLQHPHNQGYGASLKSGIRAAKHEIIVFIDADGTYPADQLSELIGKLETADMVVGARLGDNVNIPLMRRPAKAFLRLLATRIAEQPIPDLNSGFRALRRECISQYFSVLPQRFSFTSTSTLAYLADDYHVIYHPIDYYPRVGKSKIVPWDFMDFVVLIIRMAVMFNPLKIFIPLALFSGVLGVLKIIYDILALFVRSPDSGWTLLLQPALSTSAILLIFVAVQMLVVGMVADGLVRRIAQRNYPLVKSYKDWEYDPDHGKRLKSHQKVSDAKN